ncbi:AgmX/PglI C-terminal domain-containing protein [bacterium]|jgi:hypothetical protein|nr:AgmX/PglI C-terminal domain-containing protein [bacterium]
MQVLAILILVTNVFAGPSVTDGIRKKINEHMAELKKNCSPEALKLENKLTGKVTIKWSIDDEGTASQAVVDEKKTTLKNAAVHNCIIDLIYGWKFPPAPQGQSVSAVLPFTFN